MKRLKKLLPLLLVLCLVWSLSATAFAENYTYTIRIFDGDQGSVGGIISQGTNLKYGDYFYFSNSSATPKNANKYYVKGIRESGKDNNTYEANKTIYVTRDQDYVVAYGIRGTEVTYTINYVDSSGKKLADSVTYYGNPGDKPVASYL